MRGKTLSTDSKKYTMKQLYAQFVRPGDVVFDAGANVGDRTRIFAELGARVIAIEPQKECYRQLFIKFYDNPRVTIVPKALGADIGSLELHVSNVHQASSLSPELVSAEQADARWQGFEWTETRRVPVTTLDALIAEFGRPSFIKLDIEGFEAEALKALSHPVAALSFEFVSVHLKPARESIALLERLHPMQYNFSIMEESKFVLDDWVDAAEFLQILNAPEITKAFMYGDAFARTRV